MKRQWIRVAAATIAAAGLLAGIGAFVVISTGAYNVAATSAHTPMTRWVLKSMQQRSVAARAGDVPSPPPVDTGMVQHGFAEFNEMCVVCHGAPGVERGTLGKGMNPEPPDLAKVAATWSDRELFWITKHGIKLAGMPSFGVTHSDEELWSIVAVVRRLQSMSADEYRRSVADAGAHTGMHGIGAVAGGEVQASDAPAHAHPGADKGPAQEHAVDVAHATRQQPAAAQRADHSQMGHAGAETRTVRQQPAATSRADHSRMEHAVAARADRRSAGVETRAHEEHQADVSGAVPGRPVAHPAAADLESTRKLKALAAELLRDSTVLARVRADSALRRRWENVEVRKELSTPPRRAP